MYVDCKSKAATAHTAVLVNVILVYSQATDIVFVSPHVSWYLNKYQVAFIKSSAQLL